MADLSQGPVESVSTFEESLEKGYFGVKYDSRPNEDYTVAGSNARKDELFKKPDAAA